MPILDYPRWTDPENGLEIVVAPFHTGALALVPGADLKVGLWLPPSQDEEPDRLAEIQVTPFHADLDNMFRLQCTLYARCGAVGRLLDAISHHRVSVVKEDSCRIDAGRHHYVDLLLDWTHAVELQRPSNPRDRWLYRCVRERVPLDDNRYVQLYESILVSCWDDLEFDRAHNRPLPSISIQPFSGHERPEIQSLSKVERARQGEKLHVCFRVDDASATKLRGHLGYAEGDPLPYLVTSDGTKGILRVMMPGNRRLQRMAHVAFRFKRDAPGVPSSLGHFLRATDVSIITSLLRHEAADESTWELIVEAPTPLADFVPEVAADDSISGQARLSPLLDLIRQAEGDVDVPPSAKRRIASAAVRLTPPSHPPASHPSYSELVATDESEETARGLGQLDDVEETEWKSRFTAFVADTQKGRGLDPDALRGAGYPEARVAFRSLVSKALENRQPVLFLSYPRSADRLALQFKEHPRIGSVFFVAEFQSPDFHPIAERAVEKIRQSDLFVGIWHPETNVQTSLSPWMFFEYGVARSFAMPHCIAICQQLPASIRQRIEPGFGHGTYPIDSFGGEFLSRFARECVNTWTNWITTCGDELARVPHP